MKLIWYMVIVFTFFIWSCDDTYYNDGGILDEDVWQDEGSTMDFLKSQSIFDTLVILINLSGLESEVNKQDNTFFAVQNYSISNYFKLLNDTGSGMISLDLLSEDEVEEIKFILSNYIIPKKIFRDNLSSRYLYSETITGRIARFNIKKQDYLGNLNLGASSIVYSLNLSDNDETTRFQAANVISADNITKNGIVHVLNPSSHIFGFN